VRRNGAKDGQEGNFTARGFSGMNLAGISCGVWVWVGGGGGGGGGVFVVGFFGLGCCGWVVFFVVGWGGLGGGGGGGGVWGGPMKGGRESRY